MKVVVAIDSFKGCMTTSEISSVVELGIEDVYKDASIVKVPIADGGEGTVDSLMRTLDGERISKVVHDPLMRPIIATYGILKNGTAIIEMASASGLPLLQKTEQNPLKTTTYGVGELIEDAIQRGCRNFIIGIGGSATNDAGIGMLTALGYRFYDGNDLELVGTGENLEHVKRIDDRNRIKELDDCDFLVACDVNNPFYGQNGAAYVYAPQKGGDPEIVKALDEGLRNISSVIKRQYNIDLSNMPGSGAAGGLGGGLYTFLNGTLKSGIEIVLRQINLEEQLRGADIIITGEGKIDQQTIMGKTTMGIANLANKYDIPVIAIAGNVSNDAYKLNSQGVTSIFSIVNRPMTIEQAMDKERAPHLIRSTTNQVFNLIKAIKK